MADGIEDPRLGRRIIAETRLVRYERKIERAIDSALKVHLDKAEHALRTQTTLTAAAPVDAFDLVIWDTTVNDMVLPVINDICEELSMQVFEFLALPPEVRAQILGEIDVRALAEEFTNLVRTVGPRTAEKVNEELHVGVSKGESIVNLTKRLTHSFGVAESNARRIARTETHGAAERTTHASAGAINRLAMPLDKEWLAKIDSHTRKTHIKADGQRVPFDGLFQVGDAELDHPGARGSAEETINCRCTVLYIPRES